ncbi:MAG: hypothetical protein U1F43_30475 [Myxococcota bacterium]
MNSPSPSPRIRRATHRWPAGGPALDDGPDAVDAVELRRAALEAAACAAGADAAVLLRCLVWDDACYFHGALATDGQLGAELAARWEGGPAATRGWDPRRPMRGTNRRFRSGRAGPRAEPWLCERLGAQPIGDQATTMIFDGARFVALVACLRVGRARFANAAIARLNAARPALCEALVGAERAEIAALEPALTVVLDAAGAVVAAMGRARVWLARDGREAALAALVRGARRCGSAAGGAGRRLARRAHARRRVRGSVVATIGLPRCRCSRR